MEVLRVERKLGAFYTGGEVVWTTDGTSLFCQSGSSVNLLNIDDGQVSLVFNLGEDEDVTSFALSPNNKLLVVATKNDLIRQFEWKSCGTEVRRNWRAMMKTPVCKLEFDVDNRLVASASSDGALKVWDLVSKYCTHNLKGATGMFTMLRFHPKKHIVFGATSHDGTLFCWSLKQSTLLHKLEAHTSVITDLQFIDSRQGLTSSRDKVVVLWDFEGYTKIRSIPVFECVESLMVVQPGEVGGLEEVHFATVGNMGVVKLWQPTTGRCIKEQLAEHAAVLPSDIETVVVKGIYCRELRSFAVVTYEQNIVLHDAESLEPTKRFIGYNDQILDLALVGNDENMLALSLIHI